MIMERHIRMDISNGGLIYKIFYLLAFLTVYLILIYEGYKRKFPLLTWVLLLASIRLAEVIGTKIFSYSWEEWQFMFQNHTFLPNQEKTLFGCALIAVATYLFVRYLLNFKYPVWDTVAFAFPAAVSVQTIGCFFYGCCFGKPSSLPWAVQYPVMSLAHYHQFNSGLITNNDLYSLPIHPVQLYGLFGGILVILLVMRFRRYWKADGSLLLSSVIFFALMRFGLEFFRDPLSNKSGAEILWIFKQVQWQYLTFAIIMTSLLIWREKSFKAKSVIRPYKQPGLNTQIAFLFSLVIIILLLRNWFTIPELIALNIALLPAIFFVGHEVFKEFAALRFKWIYICSVILPLLLMSQTIPQTQVDTSLIKKYKTYHTIGGGLATGNYTDEGYTYTGEGCNVISNSQYFSQKYTAGGLGYSFTKENTQSDEIIKYGVNVFLGDYSQIRQSDNQEVSKFLFGFNPYIKYDVKWIGIGAGLHLGNLVYTTGDTREETSNVPEKGYFDIPIFPQFYFRLGQQRIFFADFHLADQFPVSSPGLAFQTGIGSGFGLKNGFNLRLGASFLDEGGIYISAYLPIKNRIVFEPMFQWTSSSAKTLYPVDLPEKQFSFALSYRFGHRY
jgi:prolipoprotein diacylglyceryltransferase